MATHPYLRRVVLALKPTSATGGGNYGGGVDPVVGPDVAPKLHEMGMIGAPSTAVPPTVAPHLREIGLMTDLQIQNISLLEIGLIVGSEATTERRETQPLGPVDDDQTPSRMRHQKFFQEGTLRRVGKHNRR